MLRSTFLGYKTATSALTVNQNMLDIVGQNISNVNTKGYTRQRLDISSVSFSTKNLKFGIDGVVIGQGVGADGVSQYRDSFLDLRYRMQAANAGGESAQLEALSDLETVFDEVAMEGLDAQFSDLLEQLHSLTSSTSDPVMEGVVRTSAKMLTQMFNDYSKQINTIRNQQLTYLEDGAIVKVNQLMDNIADLNKQIKEDNISGNPALELNDERNMLIDELSSYIDIEVDLTQVPIGGGRTVDELSIKLRDKSPEVVLIDDDEFIQLDVIENGKDIDIYISQNFDKSVNDPSDSSNYLTEILDNGQLNGYINFLNGKGDFADLTENDNKGVQYYSNMLDTLANKFAEEMNAANYDTINSEDKPLFDSRDGTSQITAGNIAIHKDWADATESYITNTNIDIEGDTTGGTDNILKMISLFEKKYDFNVNQIDSSIDKPLFKGTFQEFLTFSTTRLNLQVNDVETSYDIYNESQFQLDYARSSMSSVDLNEEGVNLLNYSKSYNAAARLMTTLDEMLDTLINRMAV
ncbi:flagellar hook-associated protein FlgK [Sedimentibacter sp. MB31-C6]|uniref:flagellar hook-associated protein FlgK n=1 Tax=Sedimentibacter sp. MB31-C6 TaxID=3109366 RepID=UPI002DDD7ACE|nr:flagellar hook-associated protein FlgK [Sedimentibacter sp. MB36-C1]WSI05004.1 flagellar hook-associated protein FlgK [Sedimentibacter sp. MB36-C1]